jgi:cytochrome c
MRHVIVAVALAATSVSASAQTAGDPAAGQKAFRVCLACHAIGPDAKNKLGPELNGVIGRKPGSVEGYSYSEALKTFGESHTWDVATLEAYLEHPKEVVPGNKMAFAGLKRPDQRADVIAYLATFKADGSPAD